MKRKIHFINKVVPDSALCVRAIQVKGYNDLLVTDDPSKVTCDQCLSRLISRVMYEPIRCTKCKYILKPNWNYCPGCGTTRLVTK